MTDARTASLLAHAAELEARDLALARDLAEVDELSARTAAVRARAVEVLERLDGLPGERAAAEEAQRGATADEREARVQLEVVEERIASFGRRTSQADRDQAEREVVRAREAVRDAAARVERSTARRRELDDEEGALRAESEGLVVEARTIAASLQASPWVVDAGKSPPGATLAGIEDWGARARAALLVVRGTLATQRERIVVEANTLGASVLGEPLGGSSVSLVRRRLEQALGSATPSP